MAKNAPVKVKPSKLLLEEAKSFERDAKRHQAYAAREWDLARQGLLKTASPHFGWFLIGGLVTSGGWFWDTADLTMDAWRRPGLWIIAVGVLLVVFGAATVARALDWRAGAPDRALLIEEKAEKTYRLALDLKAQAASVQTEETRKRQLPAVAAAISLNLTHTRDLDASKDDAELWAIVHLHKDSGKFETLSRTHDWDGKTMRRLQALNESWRVLTDIDASR